MILIHTVSYRQKYKLNIYNTMSNQLDNKMNSKLKDKIIIVTFKYIESYRECIRYYSFDNYIRFIEYYNIKVTDDEELNDNGLFFIESEHTHFKRLTPFSVEILTLEPTI